MRLTETDLATLRRLPVIYPSQCRALAGVGDERGVMILRADGTDIICDTEAPMTLLPGDEIELVPPCHGGWPTSMWFPKP